MSDLDKLIKAGDDMTRANTALMLMLSGNASHLIFLEDAIRQSLYARTAWDNAMRDIKAKGRRR